MNNRGTDKLLRLRDVMQMTAQGKTTIYRKMGEGRFPKPVALSESCVRWRESDVLEWLGTLMQKAS